MAKKSQNKRNPSDRSTSDKPSKRGGAKGLIWGQHPVMEAIANPNRTIRTIYLSREQSGKLGPEIDRLLRKRKIDPPIYLAARENLEELCGRDAVHQGVALEAEPLPELALEDLPSVMDPEAPSLLVILDQVSDPHNVGAILRSAAVFGAAAVITQDRNSPEMTATLLKSASGAGEHMPLVRVTNISRTCQRLIDEGFSVIGLAAEGEQALSSLPVGNRVALVLGAEGSGIRRLVRENCTALAFLPNLGGITHLNVSNAAAVALYEMVRD